VQFQCTLPLTANVIDAGSEAPRQVGKSAPGAWSPAAEGEARQSSRELLPDALANGNTKGAFPLYTIDAQAAFFTANAVV